MTDTVPESHEKTESASSKPSSAHASSEISATPPAQFIQFWATGAGGVLSQVAGKPVLLASSNDPPAGIAESADNDLRMVAVAAGGLRGEMSLRMPAACAVALAQVFLGEESNPSAVFSSGYREAAEELLKQIAGQVATSLTPRWGEVHLRLESADAPPTWSAGATGWLLSTPDSAVHLQIEWQISAALFAVILQSPRSAVTAEATPASSSHPGVPSQHSAGDFAREEFNPQAKLGLVLDAALEITLLFGGRTMKLRDVLELSAGSVVELDRGVKDPVDLLLNGKLIARGEVVVVDGNYGLRVGEVIPPAPQN